MTERLPFVNRSGGLQIVNDRDNFRYPQQPGEDYEENEFQFGAQTPTGPRRPLDDSYEQPARRHKSPIKTAGAVKLKDVQPDDLSEERFMHRDAAIVIEGEMRQQFERKDPGSKPMRFVESLVTGKFYVLPDDADMGEGEDREDVLEPESQRDRVEKLMLESQKFWVNSTIKIYSFCYGILAGMGLMHLIVIASQSDRESFLQVYSKICQIVAAIFIIFVNLGAIWSFALLLLYRQKAEEKKLQDTAMEFREMSTAFWVSTGFLVTSMVILFVAPHFTNKFYFRSPSNISDGDIMLFKVIAGAADVILIVGWAVSCGFSKASIIEVDYKAELAKREQEEKAKSSA